LKHARLLAIRISSRLPNPPGHTNPGFSEFPQISGAVCRGRGVKMVPVLLLAALFPMVL
jgi:hypothetical protein